MKRINIIFTILIFWICSCSQESKTKFTEEIKSDTLYHYDENSVTRFKAPLVNGIKNGSAYTYNDKGKLSRIATYVDDTIQGGVWEYYPSGILKSEAHYLNGKRFGDYVEFYDGYQDSTAVLVDGQWMIAPYSTKLKKYEFYDLREKVMYSREYDIDGKLIEQKGRVFQTVFDKEIHVRKDNKFSQGWITPDPSRYPQIKVKQFIVVSNLSDALITKDTVYSNPDSTVTRWYSKIKAPGEYKIQAVAYIFDNGNIETDTSTFKVVVRE